MNEPLPTPQPSVHPASHHVPGSVATALAIVMMLLALVGAGAALANVGWAERYWLYLVPVFGAICTAAAWFHTRSFDRTVLRQVLHWLAVGVVIAIDFRYLNRSGEQPSGATGLSALLILALGCLLAGIHLEWTFALVGLLLLAIAIFVAVAQEYMALVLLVGVLLIAAVLAVHYLKRKWAA
jgi:hypothetical protein